METVIRVPAERPAGTGFCFYLPRLTALRESEPLSELELFPEEDDEADPDDLPAD